MDLWIDIGISLLPRQLPNPHMRPKNTLRNSEQMKCSEDGEVFLECLYKHIMPAGLFSCKANSFRRKDCPPLKCLFDLMALPIGSIDLGQLIQSSNLYNTPAMDTALISCGLPGLGGMCSFMHLSRSQPQIQSCGELNSIASCPGIGHLSIIYKAHTTD